MWLRRVHVGTRDCQISWWEWSIANTVQCQIFMAWGFLSSYSEEFNTQKRIPDYMCWRSIRPLYSQITRTYLTGPLVSGNCKSCIVCHLVELCKICISHRYQRPLHVSNLHDVPSWDRSKNANWRETTTTVRYSRSLGTVIRQQQEWIPTMHMHTQNLAWSEKKDTWATKLQALHSAGEFHCLVLRQPKFDLIVSK